MKSGGNRDEQWYRDFAASCPEPEWFRWPWEEAESPPHFYLPQPWMRRELPELYEDPLPEPLRYQIENPETKVRLRFFKADGVELTREAKETLWGIAFLVLCFFAMSLAAPASLGLHARILLFGGSAGVVASMLLQQYRLRSQSRHSHIDLLLSPLPQLWLPLASTPLTGRDVILDSVARTARRRLGFPTQRIRASLRWLRWWLTPWLFAGASSATMYGLLRLVMRFDLQMSDDSLRLLPRLALAAGGFAGAFVAMFLLGSVIWRGASSVRALRSAAWLNRTESLSSLLIDRIRRVTLGKLLLRLRQDVRGAAAIVVCCILGFMPFGTMHLGYAASIPSIPGLYPVSRRQRTRGYQVGLRSSTMAHA